MRICLLSMETSEKKNAFPLCGNSAIRGENEPYMIQGEARTEAWKVQPPLSLSNHSESGRELGYNHRGG